MSHSSTLGTLQDIFKPKSEGYTLSKNVYHSNGSGSKNFNRGRRVSHLCFEFGKFPLKISDGSGSKLFDPGRVNYLWLGSAIYGLGLNLENFP